MADSTPGLTSFSTLPITIQLNILGTLNTAGRCSARLVCADWYHLVNFALPATFKLTNDPASWNTLKNTFSSRIGILSVANFCAEIPTCSSTRMLLPRAKQLILEDGISSENIMKLLRYANCCDTLSLSKFSFGKIGWSKMTGRVRLANIKRLSISLKLPTLPQTIATQFQHYSHLLALGHFLQSYDLPNFRTLDFHVGTQGWHTAINNNNITVVQKFYSCFGDFLRKYSEQIIVLNLYTKMISHGLSPVFHHLENLVKLQELTYTNLTSTLMSIRYLVAEATFDLIVIMNRQTLVTVNKFNPTLQATEEQPLKWLCAKGYKNLKYLAFDLFYKNDRFTQHIHHNLESVRGLRVLMKNSGCDWRNGFTRWMIQCLPNLTNFVLRNTSGFVISPYDIHTLIYGLAFLKKMELDINTSDWMRNCMELWFSQIPQIHVSWDVESSKCKICICRPLPEKSS